MKMALAPVSRTLIKLILLAFTASCASLPQTSGQHDAHSNEPEQPAPPTPRHDLFGSAVEIPTFDELTQLTPAQEREFLDWFDAPEHAEVKPHRRIADFLETTLDDVDFNDRTSAAAAALAERQGNCLSLALVTTAVARVAGVDFDWQLTTRSPVYSSQGNVAYSANHVHTRLFDPADNSKIPLLRSRVLIDYFTSRPAWGGSTLENHQIIALTYQNLAAEALSANDVDRAFHLSLEGLEHDPGNPELYNIIGLLHKRKGAWKKAEAYYLHSLEVGGERLVTLRNLEQLLLARGRDADARKVARRIVALPDSDPFPLIELGDEALQHGRSMVALNYYDRARELAPYLPDVYGRIAIVHFQHGRINLAREAVSEALERSRGTDQNKFYQAKYKKFARSESIL